MQLGCGSHGTAAWKGEIICSASGCGRLFKSPALAPKKCACGAQLLPGEPAVMTAITEIYKGKQPGDAIEADFTARCICSGCFKIHYPRMRQA